MIFKYMRILTILLILLGVFISTENGNSLEMEELSPVIFVSYAGSEMQLQSTLNLAESIRTFGGQYKEAPIWIYTHRELIVKDLEIKKKFNALDVQIKYVIIPEETSWFFLSGMVFTAAMAESESFGETSILVFIGSDTIIIKETQELILQNSVSLGYRTVTHKNISPLYTEELDTYWSKAYSLMKIDEQTIFKMITPADDDTIRPYFNASRLAVRPERGIFRKWGEMYLMMCRDSTIKTESEKNSLKRVFTFQVALIGTIVNNLNRSEIVEFLNRYNYPIFFNEMFNAKKDFHDITNKVTIR